MNMRITLLRVMAVLFLAGLVQSAKAQQDPYYSHFKFVKQAYNPATVGEKDEYICASALAHNQWVGFDDQTYGENFAPSDLTDLVGDGDRIDLGDAVLEVMETPGHSPDSLTFVDHARKWMFTGDVLINGYIVDVLHHSNKEDVLRSHQRLMAQDFEQVFGGHQYPLDREKAERVVSRYIEHKAKEGIQLDS